MGNPSADIVDIRKLLGRKVRMTLCIAEEPTPPTDALAFEEWCESGESGRPIQTHIGDCGIVQRIVNEKVLCVRFEDGDERLLYVDEVCPLLSNPCD